MRNTRIKLGPIALLLVVVTICLTVLSILSLSAAEADKRLAEKYSETVKERYKLEKKGQEMLADLSGGTAPDGWETEDGVSFTATLEEEGSRLLIGVVREEDGNLRITSWIHDKKWNKDTKIGDLWSGD